MTTGGESFLDESIQPDWLSCDALDVVAIHAYGVGDFDQTKLQGRISQAQAAGKKLILQEWYRLSRFSSSGMYTPLIVHFAGAHVIMILRITYAIPEPLLTWRQGIATSRLGRQTSQQSDFLGCIGR